MCTVREIGSEFWTAVCSEVCSPVWDQYEGDKQFYLSGRTALYAILADIRRSRKCEKAYLPSYCCDSMVDPFLRHGMQVTFYPISASADGLHAEIDPAAECDVILTVDYFGYRTVCSVLPDAIQIHDVTHSFLMGPGYHDADYYFGSLRKWGPVAGVGIACKTKGRFDVFPSSSLNSEFLTARNRGYALKAQYMHTGVGDKAEFLSLFNAAEACLEQDYLWYSADEDSVSAAAQLGTCRDIRRANAEILLNALRDSAYVRPIYPILHREDVPLFVPVLVKNGKRDALRRFLIENQVYCPVHWPMHNGCDGDLYREELSLVCDQRYEAADMQRILSLISAFEERG